MKVREFEWDDRNIEHIARYNVLPDEVEDVAFDDEPWIRKGRKGTRYMLGYTIGGRYLFIVYSLKNKGIARLSRQWIWMKKQENYIKKEENEK
jgi:hypothetical protein